jgi:hypothetical protein
MIYHRQKYQKIRKRDADAFGLDDNGGGTPVATSKSGTKRGRPHGGDVTDDEETYSPTKKVKSTKTPGAGKALPKVKMEEDVEYEDSEATTVKKDGTEENVFGDVVDVDEA